MRKIIWIVFALMLPSVALSSPARQADLRELTQLSSDILVGTVSSSESYWDGRRIMTRHVLETSDVWRGTERSGPVYFVTMGGQVGEIAQHVSGAPAVRKGDELVLFLARSHRNELHPVGLSQGVFYMGPVRHTVRPVARNLKAFEFINGQVKPFPEQLHSLKAAVLESIQ